MHMHRIRRGASIVMVGSFRSEFKKRLGALAHHSTTTLWRESYLRGAVGQSDTKTAASIE
jgi:hypothetical protein